MAEMELGRLTIIGVGLIGGSLGLALRRAGFSCEIMGAGRSVENLEKAVALGAIDHYKTNLSQAVDGAQMVMLAVPMGAMRSVLEQIKPALGADTIVTDAGSVKGSFVKDAREVLDDIKNVVPGHPIAGTENSGVEAAFASLYVDQRVILTPLAETQSQAVEAVQALWETAGARVETLDVDVHDRILAATSHLPHMLAFGLVDALGSLHERGDIFRYAAGGFRDFTRIASSDPVMWRDICIANRDAILVILKSFKDDLKDLEELIETGDSEGLLKVFQRARAARDKYVKD